MHKFKIDLKPENNYSHDIHSQTKTHQIAIIQSSSLKTKIVASAGSKF